MEDPLRLDCARMTSREAAHDYLAQVLDFPQWYGRNLDALYDLLIERGPTRLEVFNTWTLEQLGRYGEKLLDTLREAAEENPALELSLS